MAKFGGNDPALARAFQRGTDKSLRNMVTVTLGGIHQVDAQLRGAAKNVGHLLLLELLAPVVAELPSADTDGRDLQVGLA